MANEKPGGHGERPGAVGLIEGGGLGPAQKLSACRSERLPSAAGRAMLRPQSTRTRPADTGDDTSLADEVRRAIEAGYSCIKIKLAGTLGVDLRIPRRQSAHLAPCGRPRRRAFAPTLQRAGSTQRAVWPRLDRGADSAARLRCLEKLLKSYTPLATGENLFSCDERATSAPQGCVPSATSSGSIHFLSYGVGEYVRILDLFAGEDRRFPAARGSIFSPRIASLSWDWAWRKPCPTRQRCRRRLLGQRAPGRRDT